MIGYPVSEDELWRRIRADYPTWEERAKTKTDSFAAAGEYVKGSDIWSEIKPVFLTLQHSKCGYCERWLERADFGLVEHDVEHYRPKSRVRSYPPRPAKPRSGSDTDARSGLQYPFPTGGAWDTGYYWLAYNPLNYLTTCKTCNSKLKSDFFPISGPRVGGANIPHNLRDELPFLLHPLDAGDIAPESVIGFEGITAIPLPNPESLHRRARVTIDFFQLNAREDLRRQRAVFLSSLYAGLHAAQTAHSDHDRLHFEDLVAFMCSPRAAHTNCLRCFAALFARDPNRAALYAHDARLFLTSKT